MSTPSQPLVSVVTPVYNGGTYLSECIESVLAQTYHHWEYLIVDNCSTDDTSAIVKRYAERDDRVTLHSNERFLSVIENHNRAFRLISPESSYCKVVQADDWLFPECIEKMVKLAEEHPSVGLVGSYRLEEADVSCDGLPYPSTVVPGRELCRSSLLGGPYIFGSPTTLLVRSDLIRSHAYSYNEKNLHADVEACFAVLKDHDFGYVHEILSYTRRHNETETTRAKRWKTYLLSGLTVLTKYGPVYLSDQEYADMLRKLLRSYYRFLGRSKLEKRDNNFWKFHKEGMKELGHPVSRSRVLREAFIVTYNRFLDALKIH